MINGARQHEPFSRHGVVCIPAAWLLLFVSTGTACAQAADTGVAVHVQTEAAVDNSFTVQKEEEIRQLAEQLEYIKRKLDIAKPVLKNEEFDKLNRFVGYSEKLAELADALREDLAEHRMPGTNSSHTTETLAQIKLDFITDHDRLDQFAKLGLISETAAHRLGYLSFGAADIVSGSATIAAQHGWNVDATEKTLDGIAATAWGIFGYYIGKGNWEVADAFAAASRETSQKMRRMTLPMFEEYEARVSGLDADLTSLWEAAQQVRAAHGLKTQTIGEYYARDPEILDRLNLSSLERRDRELGLPYEVVRRVQNESYRETCIAGQCSRIDLKPANATETAKPLGGVRLDKTLTGANLRGVEIDRKNGSIILLGEHAFLARGLKLTDLAMALWLVYGPEAQDPEFSLDPDDIRNPSGPWLRARYFPDMLQGRSFGEGLFNADLRLKELSLQTAIGDDGKLKEWKSAVPGFETYAGMAMQQDDSRSVREQWSRFWIIADRVDARRAGDIILLDAQMAVKARRQTPDLKSRTGLRDADTDPNSLEARWAVLATRYYSELAAESPEFARVREMAVAVGVAKALKDFGAQVDMDKIAEILNADHTPTVARIGSFDLSWNSVSHRPYRKGSREGVIEETRTLRLFGGVDLHVTLVMAPDSDGAAKQMAQVAQNFTWHTNNGADTVRYEVSGSHYVALALPWLRKQD